MSNREFVKEILIDEDNFDGAWDILAAHDFTCEYCGRVGGEYGKAIVFPLPKESLEEVPPLDEASPSHFNVTCVECDDQRKGKATGELGESHQRSTNRGQPSQAKDVQSFEYDRRTLAGLAPVEELPEPEGDADHSVHHDQLEAWLPEWRDCWFEPMGKERAEKVLPYLQPKERLDDPSTGNDYSRRVKRHRKYWRILLRQNHREVPILGVVMDMFRYVTGATILLVAVVAAMVTIPQVLVGATGEDLLPAAMGWVFFVGIAILIHPYRHQIPVVKWISRFRW